MAVGVGAGVAVAIVLVIAVVVVVIIVLRKRGSNKTAEELPQENSADGGLDNPVYTGMHSTILTNYGLLLPS